MSDSHFPFPHPSELIRSASLAAQMFSWCARLAHRAPPEPSPAASRCPAQSALLALDLGAAVIPGFLGDTVLSDRCFLWPHTMLFLGQFPFSSGVRLWRPEQVCRGVN